MVYPYSGILLYQKRELSIHAAKCVDLENIMLRKETRHKDHLRYDYLYKVFRIGKSKETKMRLVARGIHILLDLFSKQHN